MLLIFFQNLLPYII